MQPQQRVPLLVKGNETAKAPPVSRPMPGSALAAAKTPPPVVTSAVAAWIAATPTIASAAPSVPSMEGTGAASRGASQQEQRTAMPAAAPVPCPLVPAATQMQRVAPPAAEPHAEESNAEWTAWLNELGYTAQ